MSDIIVLCEDRQMSVFARHFLACRFGRKFTSRQITLLPYSKGRKSGEQWVREEFPKQLEAVRKRRRAILAVMIDADSRSTADRRKQLVDKCRKQDVFVLKTEDRVLIAVPKRNIETWFAYLAGDECRRDGEISEVALPERLQAPCRCAT